MSNAGRHHYVSRFVLEEFTYDPNKQFIWQYDSQKRKWFKNNINNIAEKDLYAFNNEKGIAPDIVEREFASIESEVAPIYRDILKTQQLPNGEELDVFLYYIALLAPKMPLAQDSSISFIEQQRKNMEIPLEHLDPSNIFVSIPDGVSISIKSSVKILNTKEVALGIMLEQAKLLYSIFKQAKWIFVRANKSLKFVCSDYPLYMTCGVNGKIETISLPLSKEVAIVSGFNPDSLPGIEDINRRTMALAERFIFSSQEEML
jgi:hypothetical protein